jgi:hypothetical protein
MRMKLFVPLVLVCASTTFIIMNRLPVQKHGPTIVSASSTQQSCYTNPCPPCSYPCLLMGVGASTSTPTVQGCGAADTCPNGVASDVVTYSVNQNDGKDSVEVIEVDCKADSGTGSVCTGAGVTSYRVNSNACACNSSQSIGYCKCDGGQGGNSICQYNSGCGISDCQTIEQQCACDAGLYNPHLECGGNGLCTLVYTCGTNQCSTQNACCVGLYAPHYECEGGTCMWVNTCGTDQCLPNQSCGGGGCSPEYVYWCYDTMGWLDAYCV